MANIVIIIHSRKYNTNGDSMKRISALIMCLSIIVGSISACSKEEFINVLRFTDNFNKCSVDENIELTSYITENNIWVLPFSFGDEEVLLSLVTDDKGYIEQVRITVPKVDEKGKGSPVNEVRKNLFLSTIKKSVMAYTWFSEAEAEEIIEKMSLNSISSYKKEGELNFNKGNFRFVYYSVSLCSVFSVYNIHLHPTEKTEKPESKPAFGNTTNIRTETVPLR